MNLLTSYDTLSFFRYLLLRNKSRAKRNKSFAKQFKKRFNQNIEQNLHRITSHFDYTTENSVGQGEIILPKILEDKTAFTTTFVQSTLAVPEIFLGLERLKISTAAPFRSRFFVHQTRSNSKLPTSPAQSVKQVTSNRSATN